MSEDLNALAREIQSKNEQRRIQGNVNPADQLWWQRFSAITSVALSVLTLGVLTCTLLVYKGQKDIADRQLRIGERPYVEISPPDQKGDKPIAEWITDKSNKRTGLRIYFQNAGATPAQRVLVNGGDWKSFHHLTQNNWYTWFEGVVIPSHQTLPITINGFGEQQIADSLGGNSGNLNMYGDFEYQNIFGEYCCEPFILTWDASSGTFGHKPGGPRNQYCPPNSPNVCEIEGEPLMP